MLGSRPVAATLMGSVPPSSPPIAYPIASPGQLGDAACPIIIEPDEVDMELQPGPNEVEPKTGHVGLGIEKAPSPAPVPNSEEIEKDAGGKARNPALVVELPSRDAGTGSASPTTPPLPSLSVDMPTPEGSPTSSIGTASTCTTAPVSPVTPTMANTPMVSANTATVAGQSQPPRRSSLASKKLTTGLAPPPSLAGQKRRRSAPSAVSMYEQLLSGSGGSVPGKASSANQAGASGKDRFAGPNKRLKRSVRFKSDEDLVETRVYELQPGEVEDKRVAAGSRADGQQDPEERWKALKIDKEKKVDRDKLLEEELEDERLEKQEEEEATVAAEEQQQKFEHEMKRGVASRSGQRQTIPWYPPRKVWLSDALLFMLAEPGSESTDRALAEEAGFPSSFPSLPDNGDESLGDVVEEEPTEALSTVDFLPSNLRRDTYTLFDPFEPFGQEEPPLPQQQQQQAEHDSLHQVPAPYQPEAQVWQQQGGNALHFPPPVYHTTAQGQQHETYYPQWPSVGNGFSQMYGQAVPMSQPWQGSTANHVSIPPPQFLPAPKRMPGPTPNQQQGGSKWPSTAAQQRSPQAPYRPVAAGGFGPSSSESSRSWYPSGPPRPPQKPQTSSMNTFSAPRKTGSNIADLGAQNRFTMRQQHNNSSQQQSVYQPQQRPLPQPLAPANSASYAQRPGQGAGKRGGKNKSDKICFFFNGPKG